MILHDLGILHGTDKATYHNFCNFYESKLKDVEIKSVLEIGVKNGASLKMWRDFYPNAKVYGVDINKPLGIKGVAEIKADASKPIEQLYGKTFDLIIDDGSHLCSHQIATYQNLIGRCNKFYIVEDLHTSFIQSYQDCEIDAYSWFIKNTNIEIFQKDKGVWHDSVTGIIKL